jgi:NAD(P)-dependent dehydrogenase (short-subunit alcohol dehydrogenase family)
VKLENKVAIVSAAGRGIGKAIALCLAEAGARVVVNSYSEDTTQNTVDEITAAGGTAIGIPGDITTAPMILEVVEKALDKWQQIDILVNNVGAGSKHADEPPPGPLGPIEGMWNMLYKQNLLPVVMMTECVVPHMRKQRSGKIIHISSIAGVTSLSDKMLAGFVHPSYSAMKAALISYTQTLAETLGPDNINVNAVCPGIVYTDAWKGNAERAVKHMPEYKGMDARTWFEGIARGDYPEVFDRTPLRREQTVEDIGRAVSFLVSEDSMNITGQTLAVDGGMVKI